MNSISPGGLFDYRVRKGLIASGAAHLILILLALLVSERKSTPMYLGGSVVTVEMITLAPPDVAVSEAVVEETHVIVEEITEVVETVEETPIDENPVEETPIQENPIEENPIEENPVEETAVNPIQSPEFITVGSDGEAGSGAPGPATYEARVFNAIRRNFRTSVQPGQSYRIRFVVNVDGTVDWETLRQSGEPAFDRAVEHAIIMASIPPVPPGRTGPAVLNIEFFGPE
jgi:outer membrane biosynthesis protein TonB